MFDALQEPAPGQSRAYRYEVMTQRDGRWTVDCVMESAVDARARAELVLGRGGCDAVKVLRHRLRHGGQSISTEVFHGTRPRAAPKPGRRLSANASQADGCASLEDFSGWESRRFLAGLFRDYLTHHQLLPSELLFDWRHGKRLMDEDALVNDAVLRVARLQAQRLKLAPKVQAAVLEKLVIQAVKRARDLKAPALKLFGQGKADVLPPAERLTALHGGHGAPSLAVAGLAQLLTGVTSLEGKFERLLEVLPPAEPPWREAVETMLGECLLFAEPVDALFAGREGGGDRIRGLIDLVAGRISPEEETASPGAAAVSYLIGAGEAPHCAAALEGWIAPILASKQPLDPAQPAREGPILEQLARRLRRPDGGWIGGESVRRALESRRRGAREGALRGLGMDSAADAYGRRR